jgi:hypothetical protein
MGVNDLEPTKPPWLDLQKRWDGPDSARMGAVAYRPERSAYFVAHGRCAMKRALIRKTSLILAIVLASTFAIVRQAHLDPYLV